MSTIQEIEDAVRHLPAETLVEFRAWFAEFDAERWDRQFESDATTGRLDWLVDEAKMDFRAGRTTDR